MGELSRLSELTRFAELTRFLYVLLLLLLLNLSQIFTKTLINNIHNKLQDNTRDWNVEQDLRPN